MSQDARARRVSDYVIQLLRGESASVSRPLAPAAYVALLPTIWALLSTSQGMASPVLEAVVEHAVHVSSKSALKRWTVEFMARLVLVCVFIFIFTTALLSFIQLDTERQYIGTFRVGRNSADEGKLEEWIMHLPQTLWEIGSSNLPITEVGNDNSEK
jgi:pre-rRNA-processing protein IPI1